MAFIYFYIFYIFYICIYISLIYLRDILSFAWLTGYATRPLMLLILCIQIVLLHIIIIINKFFKTDLTVKINVKKKRRFDRPTVTL